MSPTQPTMHRSTWRTKGRLGTLLALSLVMTVSPVLAGEVPPPSSASPPAGDLPPPPAPAPPPRKPRKPHKSVSRFYVNVRPFVALPISPYGDLRGGVQFDTGIEYNALRGLWAGFELSPLAVANYILSPGPYFTGRIKLGYSGKWFGIAAVASGTRPPPGAEPHSFVGVGVEFRGGRLTATHARLRITFPVDAGYVLPSTGLVELNVPLPRRFWFHLDAGYDIGLGGVYSAVGIHYALRQNGDVAADLLTVGAGIVVFSRALGPMVTVGYEKRW